MAKSKLLVQDNALTTANYDMTSLEKNIMYAVMSQITDKDSPLKVYKISPTVISNFTKRRVRNDDFNSAVTRLLTRDFFIKNTEGYLQGTFISSAQHYKEGYCTIEISPRLRPYLFELKKNFTIFELGTATELNSKYAKRLYEMLCQFKSTGLLRLYIHEMKERLCLIDKNGIEKFDKWSSFERYVLKVAQEEINEKANFQFDYELRREGKKIVAVDFKFKKNIQVATPTVIQQPQPTKTITLQQEDPRQPRTIERMRNYGLTEIQVCNALKKHTISELCKMLHELDCNKSTIKNHVAYLLKILNM